MYINQDNSHSNEIPVIILGDIKALSSLVPYYREQLTVAALSVSIRQLYFAQFGLYFFFVIRRRWSALQPFIKARCAILFFDLWFPMRVIFSVPVLTINLSSSKKSAFHHFEAFCSTSAWREFHDHDTIFMMTKESYFVDFPELYKFLFNVLQYFLFIQFVCREKTSWNSVKWEILSRTDPWFPADKINASRRQFSARISHHLGLHSTIKPVDTICDSYLFATSYTHTFSCSIRFTFVLASIFIFFFATNSSPFCWNTAGETSIRQLQQSDVNSYLTGSTSHTRVETRTDREAVLPIPRMPPSCNK